MSEPMLVITNVPNAEVAMNVARGLVERRLAACVNVLAPVHSVYRWQGKVEEASEVTLLVKSVAGHYPDVEKAIVELHPYDVPEIVAFPISKGLPAYLNWMAQETGK